MSNENAAIWSCPHVSLSEEELSRKQGPEYQFFIFLPQRGKNGEG